MADGAQDMARSVAETMIGNCGFSQGLGMRIATSGPDFAVIEMELNALHMNGHAICHGSAIFAMADTAFAHACNSDNVVTVAQQCQVNFLKSAGLGDTLRRPRRCVACRVAQDSMMLPLPISMRC